MEPKPEKPARMNLNNAQVPYPAVPRSLFPAALILELLQLANWT